MPNWYCFKRLNFVHKCVPILFSSIVMHLLKSYDKNEEVGVPPRNQKEKKTKKILFFAVPFLLTFHENKQKRLELRWEVIYQESIYKKHERSVSLEKGE